MNSIYSHLHLDLQHKTIDSVNLKQHDYMSRYICIHITNNGNPYILEPDVQAEIKIRKPDATKIVNFAEIDFNSNHIIVEITSQMTAVNGILNADITLFQQGKSISTMPFILNVEKSPINNNDVISSDEFGILEDLIADVISDENQRQINEEARQNAENDRSYNEDNRKKNECIRLENENIREHAEVERENNEKIRIKNENQRQINENIRQAQETEREENTISAIEKAQQASQAATNAAADLQEKLNTHHFVLTEDKDVANGVPGLDATCKIPVDELHEATATNKGVVYLVDDISISVPAAATINSVKLVHDALVAEKERLNNVENKSSETIRSEITKSNVTNALGYIPYTPNEVDNKLSALETNIDWKESVNTYNDIFVTYPDPCDGWTVNVKDTDYTYRYNGHEWVTISANAIPKATNMLDGLLSKEDHFCYDDANLKKHTHDNKSILDRINEDIFNMMDNIAGHNHDDRYFTETEIINQLSGKANSDHTHDYRYYTETEVNNLLENKANSSHMHSKSQITDFPTSLPASDVYSWAKASSKPSYTWGEIGGKPGSFAPSAHSHNYLPLSGGSLNGTLHINKNSQLELDTWGMYSESSQMLKIVPPEGVFTMTMGVTDDMWTICPWQDGTYTLGTPGHRMKQVYAQNSEISTSDRNLKKDFASVSDKYIDLFTRLQPVTYRFKDGSSGRIHVGFIAQDVERAMTESGLSDLDFAGFCRDKVGEDYVYSLRYEEFIALNTAVIQRLQAKISNLEQRLGNLEAKLLS